MPAAVKVESSVESDDGPRFRASFNLVEVEKGQLLVGEGEADLGEVGGVEGGDGHSSGNELSDIHVLISDTTRERGFQDTSLEIPLCLIESGPGCLQIG